MWQLLLSALILLVKLWAFRRRGRFLALPGFIVTTRLAMHIKWLVRQVIVTPFTSVNILDVTFYMLLSFRALTLIPEFTHRLGRSLRCC